MERGDYRRGLHLEPGALEKVEPKRKVVTTSGKIAGANRSRHVRRFVVNREGHRPPGFHDDVRQDSREGDAAYRANPGELDRRDAARQSRGSDFGGTPDEVAPSLALYQFPSPQEQGSDKWLSGGKAGEPRKSLLATADFLKEQKTLQSTLPIISVGRDRRYVKTSRRHQVSQVTRSSTDTDHARNNDSLDGDTPAQGAAQSRALKMYRCDRAGGVRVALGASGCGRRIAHTIAAHTAHARRDPARTASWWKGRDTNACGVPEALR